MMLDLSSLPVSISELKPDPPQPVARGTTLWSRVVLHVMGPSVRIWQSPSRMGRETISPPPRMKVMLQLQHWLHHCHLLEKVHLCVHLTKLHHYHPVTLGRANWFHHCPISVELTLTHWQGHTGNKQKLLLQDLRVVSPHPTLLCNLQPGLVAGIRLGRGQYLQISISVGS